MSALVRVRGGVLEGREVHAHLGSYYSFRGIPYAEPPLGDLRFKAPRPPKTWEGVRSAKELGPVCYQYDMFTNKIVAGGEDCLYLNVYSPALRPTRPLPVMVWIHGGGFFSGSGDDHFYGPDFLVRHGVVLVTFNYRLEILGFLSLETADAPGNAGMKDQVAALRWVKDNIASFGGDPENVTIFGESAGGASVTYHLVSPMSKGLFKRAIAQSGTSDCWWSRTFSPRERARLLARQMGFDSNDDKDLYDFFKSQPVENLIMKKSPLTCAEKYDESLNLSFCVVDEKKFDNDERFFYEDIKDSVHENVDIIVGYTKDEGLLVFGMNFDVNKMIRHANFIPEYFAPKSLVLKCPLMDRLKVAELMENYYYGHKQIDAENLEPLVRFLSMDAFVYGIMRWARRRAVEGGNKIYLYRFSCFSERNVMASALRVNGAVLGAVQVCHADDLPYLFPLDQFQLRVDTTAKSYGMIDKVTKMWTNFAKVGDPTAGFAAEERWQPYTTADEEYLEIGERLMPSAAPDQYQLRFWHQVLEPYQQYLF